MAATDDTQVLTFRLGEDAYCVAIEYVAEVVDGDEITPLPNAESHVEGIMDLRGQTTTILNPLKILGTETTQAETLIADGGTDDHRIIVLDDSMLDGDATTGWLVSDATEVTTVTQEAVETPEVGDTEYLRGLIKDDSGFTLWLDPTTLAA